MALQLEMDEARRHMYLLLRAPDGPMDSEEIPKVERIHEALFVFRRARRLPPGDFVIKKDGCRSTSLDLALKDAVESGEVKHDPEGGLDTYSLTERGIAAAKEPWDASDLIEQADASTAKDQVADIDHKELVSFLYAEFPKTWTDPDMKKKAAEWGFEAACSMHRRGKVSITTASWMSGMDYEGFMRAYAAAGNISCPGTVEDIRRDLKAFDSTD
ncbi:hypothetical protein IBTHAUMO2_460002 [Nitrosopumilaceae archaeon]|nr:hypothetical protein [Nitrosopumilus sp.]CAI9831879.1 hypothetical protein IBTHAUMO2_460002 [Nitrosopumilaceae archaeon]MDA7942112.1 hypothetical protein [Nitrosopumilus sp.]MDA7944044.1 hypothetical protein [Nitrosopumilus sp.]MDA7945742.1 hypothetical protein [Nitrosopumilus sp.]